MSCSETTSLINTSNFYSKEICSIIPRVSTPISFCYFAKAIMIHRHLRSTCNLGRCCDPASSCCLEIASPQKKETTVFCALTTTISHPISTSSIFISSTASQEILDEN